MSWFGWAVGQVLKPRQITMEDLRHGGHIQWGWRSTEILDDDGKVIAHTPGASKPGHVGPFPVEVDEADEGLEASKFYFDQTDGGGDWLE